MIDGLLSWYWSWPSIVKIIFWVYVMMRVLRSSMNHFWNDDECTVSALSFILFLTIFVLFIKSVGLLADSLVIL